MKLGTPQSRFLLCSPRLISESYAFANYSSRAGKDAAQKATKFISRASLPRSTHAASTEIGQSWLVVAPEVSAGGSTLTCAR
eukprot:2159652-Amphidinium_carterae.1